MYLHELLSGVAHDIIKTGDDTKITKVVIDSRQVVPGALFVCLKGLATDGHDYLPQAIVAGAAAVVVQQDVQGVPKNVVVIKVSDTRKAMAYIAANFYGNPSEKLRLIGVTGTNGKTTTTCFIEEIFRNLGRVTGLIGTIGARIGDLQLDIPFATATTPDPLELNAIFASMVEHGVQDVVMEVSSHALALYKMEGLIFDAGVFTNLTQDHLDFHGTMENYALAKAQLFAKSRFAVVNSDDEYTPIMLKHLDNNPFKTYGINTTANLQATNLDFTSTGSSFELSGEKYHLAVAGKFNVYNMLAAIGVVQELINPPVEVLKKAVGQIHGVPGRIQSVPNELGVQVLVDYAHSPDGLTNIISSVREVTQGRVITLFGCGGDRDKTKRPIMGRIAGELSDYCIITSDNPRTENPMIIISQAEDGVLDTSVKYLICENRKDAIFAGVEMLKPGDALIIAGKGHEDYQEIGTTKYPFSDYGVAQAAIEMRTSK